MIFSILSFFDIFKFPVFFYIKQSPKVSTKVGILLSFLIYTFLLYNFFKSDFFEKKSPIPISQSLQMSLSENIEFNPNNLAAISVSNADHISFVDPTIFKVTWRTYRVKSNGFGATEIIFYEQRELKTCSPQDFSFNESIYQTLGLKNSFCLKNKTFNMFGYWDEPEVQYVSISLSLCNNSTDNVTCKSPEIIKDFFSDDVKFFSFYFHNTQIDLYDYKNPQKIAYKTLYQLIDLSIMKRINVFFKNSEMNSDDGWIFDAKTKQTDISYASKDYDFQTRVNWNSPAFQFLLYASKEKLVVNRRYQKLPEILGSLVGVAQTIGVFCFILAKIFMNLKIVPQILNELYYFSEKKKNRSKLKLGKPNESLVNAPSNKENTNIFLNEVPPKPIPSQIFDLKKINDEIIFTNSYSKIPQKYLGQDSFILENFSQEFEKEMDINAIKDPSLNQKAPKILQKSPSIINETKINRIKKKFLTLKTLFMPEKAQKGELNITLFQYFKLWLKFIFCMKMTKKEKMIKKAEKTFKSEMDIINILSKLHEIDHLKMVLFDDDQLILLNHLTKPIIQDESQENMYASAGHKMSTRIVLTKKRSEIKESYKRIMDSAEGNQINKRLLEFIDERHL